MVFTVAAFGALNQDSYDMFARRLARAAEKRGVTIKLVSAGPYPNARAQSEPGRPLRGEALQDPAKRRELAAAVADDARRICAENKCDILCMPCISMVGFHDDVERALGQKIFPLAAALSERYRDVDQVGVIHMRPARERIGEIFGARAVTPDEEQAARLLAAEEEAKKTGTAAPVEAVMKEIVENWRDKGITRVLFARADAPLAEKGPAGRVAGVAIESYFGILAEAVAEKAGKSGAGAALAVLLALLAPYPALAQAVPAGAEAGRVIERIAPATALPEIEIPDRDAAPQSAPAPEGYDQIVFTLAGISIEGMTAYGEKDVSPYYADLLGRRVTLADIHALAEQLTAQYRNDGYILSRVIIPPQEIDNGQLVLRAVEGFVDKVYLKGEARGDAAFLEKFGDIVTASRPLNNRDLERAVLLLGDLPGMQAESVLSASPDTPGAADLTLVVKQKDFDGYVQADNRGSRYLGPLQVNAGLTANNPLGLFGALRVALAAAPEGFEDSEMKYGGATWMQPLNALGTLLSLGGSVTSTRPGYLLTPFDTRGTARALNIALSHPFIRTREKNLTAELKFDVLNTERNDIFGIKTEDRLRVLRAGATCQFADRFLGANAVNVEVSKGLSLLNASDKGSTANSRRLGDPEFTKVTFEASRSQYIGEGYTLYTAVTGQKSPRLLLSSEEFGVGGARFGGAYDSSEITGEDGIAARVELQKQIPDVRPLQALQLYGFYDIGKVWNRDSAVPSATRLSLAGAGTGARAELAGTVNAAIEFALPLTRPVAVTGDKDARVFFTLGARF